MAPSQSRWRFIHAAATCYSTVPRSISLHRTRVRCYVNDIATHGTHSGGINSQRGQPTQTRPTGIILGQ
eukprot:8960409-Karenia_brevis.AAC.1